MPLAVVGPAATTPTGVAVAVAVALVKMIVLAALTVFVGGRVIPWVMERDAATRSRESFTLASLVLALGIAVAASKFFGVPMALWSSWQAWSWGEARSTCAPPPTRCPCGMPSLCSALCPSVRYSIRLRPCDRQWLSCSP